MTRSSYVTLIVGVATSAALATAAAIVAAQPPASDVAPASEATSAKSPAATSSNVETKSQRFDVGQLVGVSSCAASGCHGGSKPVPGSTDPDAQAAWRSSYVVWAASDPHARAYQTLKTPASAAIIRKLYRMSPDADITAAMEQRCTSCHATATSGSPNPPVPHPLAEVSRLQSIAADGIGCESCHGGAKKWLGEHFSVRTDSSTPAEVLKNEKQRLAELGMLDTDNLKVQAETCVRCHVGERTTVADGGDGRIRDMNHDLIAAGHPALNFEFAAYKARMPRHWAEPKDGKERAQRELRQWVVGQATTTAAALRLSADRAEASFADAASETNSHEPSVPWPEFSEHSCYRCHHALRSGATADSTAQQKFAINRKNGSSLPLGNELWSGLGGWHLALMTDSTNLPGVAEVRKLLPPAAGPSASAVEVKKLIDAERALARDFDIQASKAATTPAADQPTETSDSGYAYVLGVCAQSSTMKLLTWEQATQSYLACVTAYRARRAAAGLPLDRIDDDSGRALKKIYTSLRFDQPGERRFNSPASYDPEAVRKLFEELLQSLNTGK